MKFFGRFISDYRNSVGFDLFSLWRGVFVGLEWLAVSDEIQKVS